MARDYVKACNKLYDDYLTRVEKLGEDVRQKLLIPFCRKHGFEFISAMGTYFFSKGKDIVHGEWEPEIEESYPHLKDEFAKLFEILDAEVGQTHNLGHYIVEIRNG